MKKNECLIMAALLFFFYVYVQIFLHNLQCSTFAPKSGTPMYIFWDTLCIFLGNPSIFFVTPYVYFLGHPMYIFWDTLCIFFGTPYVYSLGHPMYIFWDTLCIFFRTPYVYFLGHPMYIFWDTLCIFLRTIDMRGGEVCVSH